VREHAMAYGWEHAIDGFLRALAPRLRARRTRPTAAVPDGAAEAPKRHPLVE